MYANSYMKGGGVSALLLLYTICLLQYIVIFTVPVSAPLFRFTPKLGGFFLRSFPSSHQVSLKYIKWFLHNTANKQTLVTKNITYPAVWPC